MSSSAQIWIDRLKRNSIRNISHTKWTEKYANHNTDLSQSVLIISGRNRNTRTFYHIHILYCMYESFTGPHYVSINGNSPFWVHSLTAFRREFFNFTDKLSFERSVFMCLDNGEVIRLKIVRSYMQIPVFQPNFEMQQPFCVYKTPTTFFLFAWKDYLRHQHITEMKRAKAIEQNSAVRSRIRQHLFSNVEQMFSSYIRDTHVTSTHAYAWFLTDYEQALQNCTQLFQKMTRTQSSTELIISSNITHPAPAVLTHEITNTLPTLLINSFTPISSSSTETHTAITSVIPLYTLPTPIAAITAPESISTPEPIPTPETAPVAFHLIPQVTPATLVMSSEDMHFFLAQGHLTNDEDYSDLM